jgi:HEAT repeat protein
VARLLNRIKGPLERRLKLALAGDDLDKLVLHRDRRRLRWLATDAEDPRARFRALRCLAEIGDRDAIPAFLEVLNDEPGEPESAALRVAVEGLGRLRHEESAARLRRLLNPERPAQVQLAAARALATIGGEQDWRGVRAWAVGTRLLPDDRDLAATPRGVDLPLGTDLVVQVLQTLYADKDERWWTTKAKSWLSGAEARPRIPAMEGADKIVAQQLRRSLDYLDAASPEWRRSVLRLGGLARDRDHALLSSRMLRASGPGRRALLQALGLQGDPRSLPTLLAAAREAKDAQQACDALRGLGRLGWRGGAEAVGRLRDRFPVASVQVEAAWALGEIGGGDAVRTLMDDLRKRPDRSDPTDDEAFWIATALRRCGVLGREAIRGARAIAISSGERRRVEQIAVLAGLP